MFDHSLPETAAWQDTLCRGDIVLFRFPEIDGDEDVAKMRPCLVLEVDGRDGQRRATLAYGTTSRTSANRGYEIRIKRRSSLVIAGLNRQTRFVGARTTTVDLNHPDFDQSLRETPFIGRLDTYLIERMHAVRARLQAESDIAAEVRRERREECRRWRKEDDALGKEHRSRASWSGSLGVSV